MAIGGVGRERETRPRAVFLPVCVACVETKQNVLTDDSPLMMLVRVVCCGCVEVEFGVCCCVAWVCVRELVSRVLGVECGSCFVVVLFRVRVLCCVGMYSVLVSRVGIEMCCVLRCCVWYAFAGA